MMPPSKGAAGRAAVVPDAGSVSGREQRGSQGVEKGLSWVQSEQGD